ncbi:C69 family dipeptidase, partial [bacterium]|nr:C69 family dipeptidase [bacterium]
IPWSLVPDIKVSAEEVKYILSSYYQGTPYNPYSAQNTGKKGIYRPIGINRTGVTSICQIRSGVPKEIKAIEWISFGPNAFNAMLPLYANTDSMPSYMSDVSLEVSTDNFYWGSRLIAALADPHYGSCIQIIERYQNAVSVEGRQIIAEFDRKMISENDFSYIKEANKKLAEAAKKNTLDALGKVLLEASKGMKDGDSRADN